MLVKNCKSYNGKCPCLECEKEECESWAAEICDTEQMCEIAREYCEKQHKEKLGNDTNVGGKWIPCSERLPKEDGKYLVSTDGTFGIDVIDIARFENDEWFKSCKIIAWQPLPEPYKEGET